MAVCPLTELGYLRRGLVWILHTSMGTPTVRRVRARGLQQRRPLVGRVPSRGALLAFPSEREIFRQGFSLNAPQTVRGGVFFHWPRVMMGSRGICFWSGPDCTWGLPAS